MAVCRQAGLDPNKIENAHLLFFVYNFVHKKSVESNWTFRNPNSAKSDPYWINHKLKRISSLYPFLVDLVEELEEHSHKIKFKSLNTKIKGAHVFKNILGLKSEKEAMDAVNKMRAEYVKL